MVIGSILAILAPMLHVLVWQYEVGHWHGLDEARTCWCVPAGVVANLVCALAPEVLALGVVLLVVGWWRSRRSRTPA